MDGGEVRISIVHHNFIIGRSIELQWVLPSAQFVCWWWRGVASATLPSSALSGQTTGSRPNRDLVIAIHDMTVPQEPGHWIGVSLPPSTIKPNHSATASAGSTATIAIVPAGNRRSFFLLFLWRQHHLEQAVACTSPREREPRGRCG